MMDNLLPILATPRLVLIAVMLISLMALIAAFSSEAFLGLEPCILCVYQRWPYALVILCGLLGVAFKKAAHAFVAVSGLAFLVNSGLALYHTGVEQHWWASAFEGCLVPDFSDEPQSILENIMSAPSASCSEIPWQDPLLGLSMANYNAIMCFGLFVICAACFALSRKTEKAQTRNDAEH